MFRSYRARRARRRRRASPWPAAATTARPRRRPVAPVRRACPATVTVFAAASLTESFTELGKEFEAAHPGVKVTFNFAGSSALAKQINQGAPADVFASAAPKNMDRGHRRGRRPTDDFVTNKLEIAVPKGNPGKHHGPRTTSRTRTRRSRCAPSRCRAARRRRRCSTAAGITPQPDTLEQDVKAALTKVSLGEVDAALVYKTDVLSAEDKVEGIEFPEAEQGDQRVPDRHADQGSERRTAPRRSSTTCCPTRARRSSPRPASTRRESS